MKKYLNRNHSGTAPNQEYICCGWDIYLDLVVYTDLYHHNLQQHSLSLLDAVTLTGEYQHAHPIENQIHFIRVLE
jgi:hypothetical protein